jgi:hypothetical protein
LFFYYEPLSDHWRKIREKERIKEEEMDHRDFQREMEQTSAMGNATKEDSKEVMARTDLSKELSDFRASEGSLEPGELADVEFSAMNYDRSYHVNEHEPNSSIILPERSSSSIMEHVSPPPPPPPPSFEESQPSTMTAMKPIMGFGLKFDALKTKPTTQSTFAATVDDDERHYQAKRRIILPILYTEEELRTLGLSEDMVKQRFQEERKRAAQAIAEQIPVNTTDLFSYELDYDLMTEDLLQEKVKPWIQKKLTEANLEPSISDTLTYKLAHRVGPSDFVNYLQVRCSFPF